MRKNYNKWHCFTAEGKKVIRCHLPGVIPTDWPDHTPWVKGSGPFDALALANVRKAVQLACKGVPKSDVTRQRMSKASKGKPKSPEHRAAMSRAHKERFQRMKEEQ